MTKLLGIGDAIYKEGTSIQISKPDDWGWYYRNDEGDVAVIQVKKNWMGKWVKSIPCPDKQQNIEIEVALYNNKVSREKNGFPYEVLAEIRKKGSREKVITPLKRISLKRYFEDGQVTELVKESGYYPTLFIFMLGSTTNGKTCFLNSLGTSAVRKRVQRRQIRYFNVERTEIKKPLDPTKLEVIEFKPFYFLLKENGKDKNKVIAFIVDLAGESINCEDPKNAAVILRNSIREYASGIFVVRSAKWLINQKDQIINQYDPSEYIFQHLDDDIKDKLCYVLTGADLLKKELECNRLDKKLSEELNLTPDGPIFRPVGNTEQMYENMAITSYIMNIFDADIVDSPCFAVSCCCDIEDEKGNKLLDFGQSYNTDLPITYMLQRLIKR